MKKPKKPKHDSPILIELFWSVEDQEYVVRLARQHGISALGKTIRKSLKEFGKALPIVIEMAGYDALKEKAE